MNQTPKHCHFQCLPPVRYLVCSALKADTFKPTCYVLETYIRSHVFGIDARSWARLSRHLWLLCMHASEADTSCMILSHPSGCDSTFSACHANESRACDHLPLQFSCQISTVCMGRACAADAGPSLPPLQAHRNRTAFSTLKRAPSSPLDGLRDTMFSVELGARSCNLLRYAPHLSPTARKSRDPTQSPRLATGQTFSVSSRTAFCSQMSP